MLTLADSSPKLDLALSSLGAYHNDDGTVQLWATQSIPESISIEYEWGQRPSHGQATPRRSVLDEVLPVNAPLLLVMMDPDAPKPSYLHWLSANLTASEPIGVNDRGEPVNATIRDAIVSLPDKPMTVEMPILHYRVIQFLMDYEDEENHSIAPYMEPNPPQDQIHRYVFSLYQLSEPLDASTMGKLAKRYSQARGRSGFSMHDLLRRLYATQPEVKMRLVAQGQYRTGAQ